MALNCTVFFLFPFNRLPTTSQFETYYFPAKTLHVALVLFPATLPDAIIAHTSRPITLLTDPEIIILPS